MQEIKLKIRYIYIPFLLLYIGIEMIISAAMYYFIGYDSLDYLKNLCLVLLLSIIGIYVFLKPRINLLRFREERKKEALYVFAFLPFVITSFFLNGYWASKLGKLSVLDKISMINDVPKTKFYQLKNKFIDEKNTIMTTDTTPYKNRLIYHCRFKTPILDDSLFKQKPIAWICNNMERSLSNEKEFREFIKESQLKFQEINVAKFQYLEFIENQGNVYFFEGKNIPFEHRNQAHIRDAFSSFLIGIVLWFCLLLYFDLDYLKLKDFTRLKFKS